MSGKTFRHLGPLLIAGALSLGAAAQTAARYDSIIQTKAAQELQAKPEFRKVQARVEDGIVTLAGTVDLYQQKLAAAKKVRKVAHVQGVRNRIEVAGKTVPDAALAAQLDRELHYDRMGYDNLFNFISASVKGGVVTLGGETMTEVGRDSALAIVQNLPGVKDVVSNITVAPVSSFDDDIRARALRAIYDDPVLGRYASDPALPIRILVNHGKLSLYGTVENAMDKQIAGLRAGEVFGAFSVENHLVVAN